MVSRPVKIAAAATFLVVAILVGIDRASSRAELVKRDCASREANAALHFEWGFRGRQAVCEAPQIAAPVIPWKIQ